MKGSGLFSFHFTNQRLTYQGGLDVTDILLESCDSTLAEKPATWSINSAADAELAQRILCFLGAQQIPGLDQLRVTARGGEVSLSGCLPTSRNKARCVELCQHVAGVIHVRDQIEVLAGRR